MKQPRLWRRLGQFRSEPPRRVRKGQRRVGGRETPNCMCKLCLTTVRQRVVIPVLAKNLWKAIGLYHTVLAVKRPSDYICGTSCDDCLWNKVCHANVLRQSTSAYLQKQNIDTEAIAQEYNWACHAKVKYVQNSTTKVLRKVNIMAKLSEESSAKSNIHSTLKNSAIKCQTDPKKN
ncbi:hypothetical protein E2320_017594 [Naja naja]|nr:hypothetical protein E2320_017594 [Naja naja]